MKETKLVNFGISYPLLNQQSSIENVLPTIISEIARDAIAKGLKFDFEKEWNDPNTDTIFYKYRVDQDVNIQEDLLVSTLRQRGIEATVKTEKIPEGEKYIFGL